MNLKYSARDKRASRMVKDQIPLEISYDDALEILLLHLRLTNQIEYTDNYLIGFNLSRKVFEVFQINSEQWAQVEKPVKRKGHKTHKADRM